MTKTKGPGLTPEAKAKLMLLDINQRAHFGEAYGCSERTVRNWATGASRPIARVAARVEKRLKEMGK